MKYFEIQIPIYSNTGQLLGTKRDKFEQWLLQYAGGYSFNDGILGAWRDGKGEVFSEAMIAYRVACDAVAFEKILAAAFDLFDDQHAIFYAELGEATIRNRAAPKVSPQHYRKMTSQGMQAAE